MALEFSSQIPGLRHALQISYVTSKVNNSVHILWKAIELVLPEG
jgi:hypothetical protein